MGIAEIQAVLKGKVTTTLVTDHDFSIEEAEEAVEESMKHDVDIWHENADPEDIANYLASDDDEE